MRTEFYSLRSDAEEISYINDNLRSIVDSLSENANTKILFKTEIDCNPKKIKADLFESYDSPNPPELQLFVNALDTKDKSSFCNLFLPFIEAMEKEIIKSDPPEYRYRKLLPQIKVHTLDNLPGDYPAYFFTIKRRKFLVLPRINLIGSELTDFLTQAINIAKEKFFEAQNLCPNGYIYYKKENKKQRDRFDLCFDTEEDEAPQHITKILADTPDVMFEETFFNTAEQKIAKNIQARDQKDTEPEQDILYIAGNDAGFISSGSEGRENKGFKAFLRRTFPVREDSLREKIRKIVFLLAIIAFFTGAFLLLKFYVIDPARNNADMAEIQEIFYSQTDSTYDESSGDEQKPTRNWEGLKKVNKEIAGWIKIDNSKIDYPVLWHKGDTAENQYYIYRNYKKDYSDFGSIFMDFRCKKGPDSRHVILHGHNMGSDDSMFGSLLKYAIKDGWTQGNTDYYKKSPIVHFDTPKVQGDWIIFSVMKINADNNNKSIFNYLQTEFESDSQFMNFLYNIKMRSYLKVDVPLNENDRILTLSTCSYESDNMRTVVVARKIRPGEDVTKYIAKAKKTSPYSTVYSTFKEEYEANKISWYDGNAKFTDNGELEFLKPGDTYTVTFLDGRGKVYETQKVLKGKDAKVPVGTPPGKASDGVYYYRFTKWSGSLKNITSDRTIQALYEKVKIPTPIQKPAENPPADTEVIETKPPVTESVTPTPTDPVTPPTEPIEPTAPPEPTQAEAAES